jgi:hypothetical protein
MCIGPQSEILILVDSWPPTPKIWWPNSNFSGQRKEKLVAKIHGKKVKINISRSFAWVIFVQVRPFITILLCFWFLLWILRVSLKSYKALIKEIGISGHTWNNYLTKFTSH